MPTDDTPILQGHTREAVKFMLHNRRVTVDEVAIHLGVTVAHARDILFRARARGIARKLPITYSLTNSSRAQFKGMEDEPLEPAKTDGAPSEAIPGV